VTRDRAVGLRAAEAGYGRDLPARSRLFLVKFYAVRRIWALDCKAI